MILFLLYFLLLGILISYQDFKEQRISNKLSLGFFLGTLIFIIAFKLPIKEAFLGLLLGMSILLLLYFLTKGGIGEGDLKLSVSLFLLLGLNNIWYFFLLVCGINLPIAIYLILVKKKTKDYAFPFGPVLLLSFFILFIPTIKLF